MSLFLAELHEYWYLGRAKWHAIQHEKIELLSLPVKYVIIGYDEENYCNGKDSCIRLLRNKQLYKLLKYLEDIGPNYLISYDGLIFEGRGANVIGDIATSYDHKSISVMFFGFDDHHKIPENTFFRLNQLLEQLKEMNVLHQKYTILAHCQIDNANEIPRWNIMKDLKMYSLAYYQNIIFNILSPWRDFDPETCYRS